ncbi:hypothetical protein CGH72_08420 [Vibrio parahaemolyticus]|nr:hypothetical protein CGI25_22260 [Vibrio parahaemolyticus]TOM57077.1 hypothetical protein CGH75_14830 [Vibrio parahaemolyticus]TOM64742.1 hypothetical protein CGH73_20850 [Vibrio parahaemolyticus]TOM73477.1 hypothetical protein CGH72_08420 [Vibrio parahaemolyticus]TOO83623.1 hypothetical protein CGH29_19295 [Vibrio parahaemolyticus]
MTDIQTHKYWFFAYLLVVLVFFAAPAEAVDMTTSPPMYRTLGVDTQFDKEAFYDRKIIDFSFVKGTWNELDFDRSSHAFKSITDVLRLHTNLPKSDISSETYQLSMVRNWSVCSTRDGGVGSRNIVTVSVMVGGVSEDVTSTGTAIGGGPLLFEQSDRTGLYAEHPVTLTFAPIDDSVDRRCVGVVKMKVELGL